MMKLKTLLLVTLLAGCTSTDNEQVAEFDINALDLRGDKSQTENYWVVMNRSYPKYPVSAARKGVSGCVEFSFVIDELGKARNIQIINSVPENTFNKAAMKTMKEFRWAATKSNDLLQPVLTTLQLDFSTSPKQTVAECIAS
jgi:periplasmic protein TonB